MKNQAPAGEKQKKFDFSPSRPRPLLSGLPGRIDSYEEGVAHYFRWRTGLDYYHALDQVVDFVVQTGRIRVIDLLTDTAAFSLRLAGRKSFHGRIYSFDTNITLLERAKQRAAHLGLEQIVEFRHFQEPRFPVPDGHAELAVSVFDLHRHPLERYFGEAMRILAREGHLILAEYLEPKGARTSLAGLWRRAHLRFVQKNPVEARAVYPDREELIGLLFRSGFRQVIVQELCAPRSRHSGAFSIIAATK
ncbi:MAG: methyltransferase domain-containing protein [Acidobacteriota bacterium]|nr:methyltransferase domain-containing protein [Acidobacteriota bacterium]NLT34233.1 methyltransferase domain-containing protein [Acidobacteriota bacterium]